MNKFVFALLLTLPICCLAQESQKLSIEFDYGYMRFSMKDLNRHYIDSFAIPHDMLDKTIKQGQSGSLFLRYHLNSLTDLGIYSSFQTGKTSGEPVFYQISQNNEPMTVRAGTFEFNTQALSIGISNTWHLSQLWHFAEKSSHFMQRSDFAVELNLGMAFTRSISYLYNPFIEVNSTDIYINTAQAFQGQLALKYGYELSKTPLISRIGLKVGYQYLRSQVLEDKSGDQWVVMGAHPIRLDFSGLFAGIYLEVGR